MAADASAQLRAIAVRLREAGDRANLNALRKSIRTSAAPLTAAVKDAARAQLPKGGGLNEQVANQRVSVSIRTGARTAGVRMTMSAPDTGQTDQGYVRHPVYGNRNNWVQQSIPDAAGWWSQTLADRAPAVQPLIVAELARVAAWIESV